MCHGFGDIGGRAAWIGLAITCILQLRALELFADDRGDVHEVCFLRGGDTASFRGA